MMCEVESDGKMLFAYTYFEIPASICMSDCVLIATITAVGMGNHNDESYLGMHVYTSGRNVAAIGHHRDGGTPL